METAYRCLACGGDIIYEETLPANSLQIVGVIKHPGEMDAACRWALAALADDLKRSMEAVLRSIVSHLPGC